ncbi:DUF4179 domain-containing protein [Paenibacillus sp. MBLB4367]|uniref:DUF4179 domain-containing protein n=1 Tax=Paenibacillus sp. MBLB4367 TaxID=3384767 RepID=UPI003907EF02
MKREEHLKRQIERTMDHIPVPESLYRFAAEVPERFAKGETSCEAAPLPAVRRRKPRFLFKSAAAAAILLFSFAAGVKMSPTFAALAKGVPGIEIAMDWLSRVRELDGVQTAVNHGYMPIEPVTKQLGGTTITIGDIYLTDEELLFKTFMQSEDFDVADERGTVHLFVAPENLEGGGSTTAASISTTTDGSGKQVLQETYKFQLTEGAAQSFLTKGEALRLTVRKHTWDRDSKLSETKSLGQIEVPIEPGKLLHNRVLEPKLSLSFDDRDWKGLTLEKLTIQPTTMNVILNGLKGWNYDFPREDETAPYLEDDKGNVYRYDPSGPGLILEEGKLQLPFSSSVFFDPDVRTLTLHIGELVVGEWEPSGRFEVDLNGSFPQRVSFKGRELVIAGADYVPEGYLRLKISKENPEQRFMEGVAFDIAEKEDLTARFENESTEAYDEYVRKQGEDRETFNVSGFGSAEDYNQRPYLSVYIPAPKLDRYTVTLSRAGDTIVVDKDYAIPLKQ